MGSDKDNITFKLKRDLISRVKQASAKEQDKHVSEWISRALESKFRKTEDMFAKTGLFLDDERDLPPGNKWVLARSYSDFISYLPILDPEVIAFDHDLGAGDDSVPFPDGFRCMQALIDFGIRRRAALASLQLVILHSANPIGRANLRGLFEGAQRAGYLCDVRIEERPVTQHPIDRWPLL